jgi:iron complex transport system substrate-binding protein
MQPSGKLLPLLSLIISVIFFDCTTKEKPRIGNYPERSQQKLDYAKRFEIWNSNNLVEVVVNLGEDSGESFRYALVPSGHEPPKDLEADQIIEIPVEEIVVTSTSHLPFLDLVGASHNLVGFPNTKYVSTALIRSRIDQGLVKEVGTANGLDMEVLIELQPELVVSYISGANRDELQQLEQSGIPTVLNLDFLETTPLGRAEWVKFMGLLLGRNRQADSVFKEIEKNYLTLESLVDQTTEKPEVFSGIVYGDTWFAPGGDSFVSKFIEDAGGFYTWKDYPGYGSIELSFESILERNANTEFWIGSGGFTAKEALAAADPRYGHFQAFKNNRVFNYHGKIGATGGFEYLETAGARPDLVLGDMIKIIHPELLPNYQSYFFKRLD